MNFMIMPGAKCTKICLENQQSSRVATSTIPSEHHGHRESHPCPNIIDHRYHSRPGQIWIRGVLTTSSAGQKRYADARSSHNTNLIRPYIKLIKFILTHTHSRGHNASKPRSTNANKYFNLFLFTLLCRKAFCVHSQNASWMASTMIRKAKHESEDFKSHLISPLRRRRRKIDKSL